MTWPFTAAMAPPRAADPSLSPSRILILKPSSLGDIIHTLPAVAALRAKFPGAHLTWMVNPQWAPLLKDNPQIDETLDFPRADFHGPAGWLRFHRWLGNLKKETPPDLILDFQGLLRTAMVARAFRPAPVFGLSDAREGAGLVQRQTATVDPKSHAVGRYLALAALAGATPAGKPLFDLPAGQPVHHPLPAHPYIVLHPFSRGSGKSLSPEATIAFCQAVKRPVVLVGRTPKEVGHIPNVATDLLNQTDLIELVWLLRQAAFVVSVDSGPMHLAAAVTDQLLAIHTWSDPSQVGPYCPGASVWKGKQFFSALDPRASTAGNTNPSPEDAIAMAQWVNQKLG